MEKVRTIEIKYAVTICTFREKNTNTNFINISNIFQYCEKFLKDLDKSRNRLENQLIAI